MQEGLFDNFRPETNWKPPQSLPELSQYPDLGFDTETDGIDIIKSRPVGLSICTPDKKRYYLPWGHRGGGNLDPALIKRWAQRELRGKTLYGVNCKFDNHMMLNWGVDLEAQGNRMGDMAYRAALINENRFSGFNLDSLAKEFLEPGEFKVYQTTIESNKIAIASAGEIAPRAEQDAFLAYRLHEATKPLLDKEELWKVTDLEDNLIYAVAYMERNGAKIDMEKLHSWRKEVKEIYGQMVLDIYHEVKFRVNPNSGKDMQKLFDHLKLSYPRTENDEPSFEAKFLKTVKHPLVQAAFRARRLHSLNSKYLDKYAKAIGPGDILRYNLHQLRGDEYGTISGRFACANVNIQQVMKVSRQIKNLGNEFIIRELFIPEKDHLYLKSDAAQIEFRLFAHYANSAKLNEAYRQNPKIDFHNLVRDMIIKVNANFNRDRAKGINFGKLYGMGKDKLRRELELDSNDEERALADELGATYDREFPEAKRLLNSASKLADTRGYVKTYLGRRARFQAKERLHSALNRVIQGTAADVMKQKILELYRERKTLEFTMRMTVHDEVDGDVPSMDAAKKVEECLNSQSFPFRVPILWDVEAGNNWRMGEGE